MRYAVFLLFLALSAAAHAADNAPANAGTQAVLAGSVVQCEAPVAMDNAAAAEAIAKAAETGATAYAARLTELPAKAAEIVAALASAHSLEKALVARAYIAAMCARLKEKGVADAELLATLTRLAQDFGVPQAASAEALAVPAEKAAGGGISALIAPDGAKPGETPPAESAPQQQPLGAARVPEESIPMPPPPPVSAKKAELEQTPAPLTKADEVPAAAEEKPMDEAPVEKSLIRPEKAAKPKAKPKTGDIAALGEDECRALGVLENCPDLNSVFGQLLEKPLEYNRPDKMLLGRKTEISLVLRTDWKGKDAPPEISDELKGLPGEVQKGVSKITRVMSAELSGADFDVSPAGRQERTVILPQPVVWSWQVTPAETGNAKPLKLRLYAHLQGPGGTMPPVLIKTLDATITVDVTAWDWVVSQAKALEPIYAVVAGLLGLATAIVTYFFTRKEEAAGVGGGAETITVRPSGPVLGDLGQSASDSKAPVHTAPPPPVKPESEPEDVPWRPKKLQPPEGGGSSG